ncbi:MAG: GNAT family N-acetyltransferase [Blastopirellula sp.]|nr:MAG: GNAT family N-acetyltransferase [Blastopirellula sp.]
MTIDIAKLESLDVLGTLKQQYIDQATAPLDGMWLCGFVPLAAHFGFYVNEQLVGYCCVDEQGHLLQFYLSPIHQHQSAALFEAMLRQQHSAMGKISGAFVSTAEPQFLSLCLDHFPTFKVNALMYQRDNLSENSNRQSSEETLPLTPITSEQLSEAIQFAHTAIGAPESWLASYYGNLIARQELLGLWRAGQLIATGEIRGYDQYQTSYADLGVIVAEPERGQGLATQILKQLATQTEAQGLKPICSTEATNIAAQKAIAHAGFFAGNRIIQFEC